MSSSVHTGLPDMREDTSCNNMRWKSGDELGPWLVLHSIPSAVLGAKVVNIAMKLHHSWKVCPAIPNHSLATVSNGLGKHDHGFSPCLHLDLGP